MTSEPLDANRDRRDARGTSVASHDPRLANALLLGDPVAPGCREDDVLLPGEGLCAYGHKR